MQHTIMTAMGDSKAACTQGNSSSRTHDDHPSPIMTHERRPHDQKNETAKELNFEVLIRTAPPQCVIFFLYVHLPLHGL